MTDTTHDPDTGTDHTGTDATGADGAEPHDQHAGWSDGKYIQLAAILAVITALEVYASYADWLGAAFIPALLIMMVVKFAAVVLFFMHLRFDSPIFGWLFYGGLFLALGVYIAALLTFQFFNP